MLSLRFETSSDILVTNFEQLVLEPFADGKSEVDEAEAA